MRQALPRALHARCARRAQKALPAQAAHQRPVIRAGLASGASHSCFVPALVCALSPPARTPMEHSTVLADASGECGRYAAGSRRTSTGAEPLGSRGQRQRRQEQPRPPHAIEQVDEAPDLDAGGHEAIVEGIDTEILRLLVPATLAVFLDPAMALIDTGATVAGSQHVGICIPGRSPERGSALNSARARGWFFLQKVLLLSASYRPGGVLC